MILLFQKSNFCGNFITFLLTVETLGRLFIFNLQPIKEVVSAENDAEWGYWPFMPFCAVE